MASAVAQSERGKMYRLKPFFDTSAEIISNVAMYKVKKFVEDTTGILVSTSTSKCKLFFQNSFTIRYTGCIIFFNLELPTGWKKKTPITHLYV